MKDSETYEAVASSGMIDISIVANTSDLTAAWAIFQTFLPSMQFFCNSIVCITVNLVHNW